MDSHSEPSASDKESADLQGLFETRHGLGENHPELYGRLLIANEKIENAGTLAIWVMMAVVVGACVTIHMEWVPAIFGIPVARLQGWGVYLLIALVAFVLYCVYAKLAERRAWQSARPPVIQYLNRHQLTIPWLIAQVNGDDSISDVIEHLKSENLPLM